MGLGAYLPLEGVYAFHELAESWILRRYPPGTVIVGAERVRGTPSESVIQVFRDRSTRRTSQKDGGQDGPATCTVCTRTRLRTTEDSDGAVQAADVLFNPADGSAWQATSSGDWDEARGFAVVLTQAGTRGSLAPWA